MGTDFEGCAWPGSGTAVKEGTKGVLNGIFGDEMIARAVRYCLVVITAGILWPLSFKWFSKLGKKE